MDNSGKPNIKDLIKKAVDEQVQKSLQDKQKTDRQVSFQLVEDKAPVEVVKDEVVKLQGIVEDKMEDLIETTILVGKKLETKEGEKLSPTLQALNNNFVSSISDLKKAVGEVERATKANKPSAAKVETFKPVTDSIKSLEKAFKDQKLTLPTDAKNPIAVRLSDGEEFVNQLTQVITKTQGVGGGSVPKITLTGGIQAVPVVNPDGTSIGTSGGGGTQYEVDAIAGGTDTGTLALMVRDDALTTLTPADGDYTQGRVDSVGATWVNNAYKLDSVNDSISAVQSGTWNIGTVTTVAAVTAITNALPAGSNVIGAITNIIPGTGNTNLGASVDAAAGATKVGVLALGVRDDALATLTPVDNDYTEGLRVDSTGAHWVHATTLDSVAVTAAGLGKAEDAGHNSGDTGVAAWSVRNDNLSTTFAANLDYQPFATDLNGRTMVAQKAATATLTNVGDSASSVTVLAANSARIGATITNDSSAVLYLKFGATASTTSYTVSLAGSGSAPFSYYEVPAGYTGIIDGIWASDAGGNARVTEIT